MNNAWRTSSHLPIRRELLDRQRFRTRTEAGLAVFDYFEGF
jgi:hypothetical protein